MENYLVNISIDDVSPHPFSSTRVLEQCFTLIDKFPDIKFTLFIPTSYWRTVKPSIATNEPLRLDLYPDFCKEIKNLPRENFEIGFHGHFHGIPGKNDNDELRDISYNQAKEVIAAMKKVVKDAGLEDVYKPIIRPPAWRMSPDAIKAFRDEGFKIFALSPDDYAVSGYQKEHLKRSDFIMYNVCPPQKPLKLFSKTEIVYHACEWDKNYLSPTLKEELFSFLDYNIRRISFSFMEEMMYYNGKV
jgi:predicted deacetylase